VISGYFQIFCSVGVHNEIPVGNRKFDSRKYGVLLMAIAMVMKNGSAVYKASKQAVGRSSIIMAPVTPLAKTPKLHTPHTSST
jgi:hypothetical protein